MTLNEVQYAIMKGRGPCELAAFVATGGNLNQRFPDSGSTLLHLAVEFQNLPAIKALVHAGADLEAREAGGSTPLHHAVDIDIDSVGQSTQWIEPDFIDALTFATAGLLISLGANPNALDNGRTPRELAARAGCELRRAGSIEIR